MADVTMADSVLARHAAALRTRMISEDGVSERERKRLRETEKERKRAMRVVEVSP